MGRRIPCPVCHREMAPHCVRPKAGQCPGWEKCEPCGVLYDPATARVIATKTGEPR